MPINAISNNYLPQMDFFGFDQPKPVSFRYTVLKSEGFRWQHLFFPPLLIVDLFSLFSKQKPSRYNSIIQRMEKGEKNSISKEELEKFLNEVENGTFEKKATDDEILRATNLLINYARQGTEDCEEQKTLEHDVHHLFSSDGVKLHSNSFNSSELPRTLCECYQKNGKKSNIFKRFGKFVKKHRKAIIITAVAVVAVVIIAVAAVAIVNGAAAAGAAQGATAATGALAGVAGVAQSNTKENEPTDNQATAEPLPKIEPEIKVIPPNEDESTSKIGNLIKETLTQNTPHPTANTSTLHKILDPIAQHQPESKVLPKNYPLQSIHSKTPTINQTLEQQNKYPHGQYPITTQNPKLDYSYQLIGGINQAAIITNIEKTKQKIQTYGNQLADELKITATTLSSNLIPIITNTHQVLNNREGNIAILQNIARGVNKIDEFANFPFAPYPLDYEYVSNTTFDSLTCDRHYNHFTNNHPYDQVKQKYFSDRKDTSLTAIRGRIKDGKGLEEGLNTLDYCNLDSLNLLAHMNPNDFAIPSRTTKVISLNRPELEHHKIIVVGGILTAESGTRKIMTKVSDENGGCNVYGISKPSFGPIIDIIRAGQALFKYTATEASYVLTETNSTFLSQDPLNTTTICGHSHGGVIARNGLAMTPQKLLSKINSCGIAPLARIVSPDMNSIKHVVSNGDFVHCLDVHGEQAAMGTTISLNPHPNSERIDHGALSKTFEPYLKIIPETTKKGPSMHE